MQEQPSSTSSPREVILMNHPLIWIAILLIVIWIVARLVLAITSFALHLLWIAAIVLFLIWLARKIF